MPLQVIAAARQNSKRGYGATSVNAVAAQAGVDPALIRRFFGSEEGLLNAALTSADEPRREAGPSGRGQGSPGTLGERMTSYFFTVWEQPPNRDVMIGAR